MIFSLYKKWDFFKIFTPDKFLTGIHKAPLKIYGALKTLTHI